MGKESRDRGVASIAVFITGHCALLPWGEGRALWRAKTKHRWGPGRPTASRMVPRGGPGERRAPLWPPGREAVEAAVEVPHDHDGVGSGASGGPPGGPPLEGTLRYSLHKHPFCGI